MLTSTTQTFRKHIDWLSVTFPRKVTHDRLFPFYDWRFVGKGQHGYQAKYVESITGTTCQEASSDETMGTHLTISGKALEFMRVQDAVKDEKLIEKFRDLDGRPSRIDLAIDCANVQLQPHDFKYAMQGKEIKTLARKWSFIEGSESDIEGSTFYLGNRISDKFFRAYDKAAESRVVDRGSLLRLELELKGLAAVGAFHAILQHGLETTINSQFLDFAQWQNPDYCAACCCEYVQGDRPPATQRNTELWMFKSVIPAFTRLCIIRPAFFDAFMAAFQDEMKRINDLDITSDNATSPDKPATDD